EIPLELAADELDTLRRRCCLASTTPSSRYYLANCRVLHSRDVSGPTAVAGWKNYVSGEPMVKNKNILIVGESGSRFYSPNGKKSSPLTAKLMEHAGYPNMYDLTEVGAHPRTWLNLLQQWK
ncbi:MAG: hypothetical protein ACKPKO_12875, partial [Candidatus Fonsibacter sp.]